MIWVVDDDPDLRQMVGTYLLDQGYDVRSLSDVKQLEARLEFQRPDLIVLDLMMPGDDGLTALRRLRDAGDDLPVVMLTARGEGVDRIIGLEQGADDYLAKPFLPRELSARIEAVLRRRSSLPAGTPLAEGGCGVWRECSRSRCPDVDPRRQACGDHQWGVQPAGVFRSASPPPTLA